MLHAERARRFSPGPCLEFTMYFFFPLNIRLPLSCTWPVIFQRLAFFVFIIL